MADDNGLAEIQEHRNAIDEIDARIVALINERALHSLKIRSLKPNANMGLYDPQREAEILQKVRQNNEGPLYNEHLCEIYTALLKVMKEAPSL